MAKKAKVKKKKSIVPSIKPIQEGAEKAFKQLDQMSPAQKAEQGVIKRKSSAPVEENIIDARAETRDAGSILLESQRLKNEQAIGEQLRANFNIEPEEAPKRRSKVKRRKK